MPDAHEDLAADLLTAAEREGSVESCIACYGTTVCPICNGQASLAQPEPTPRTPCESCGATGVCRYCSADLTQP